MILHTILAVTACSCPGSYRTNTLHSLHGQDMHWPSTSQHSPITHGHVHDGHPTSVGTVGHLGRLGGMSSHAGMLQLQGSTLWVVADTALAPVSPLRIFPLCRPLHAGTSHQHS
jgi:hypothetical protein